MLGFAIGPLFFAPLSEVMGRRIVFIGTYGAMTAFNIWATGSKNIETLLIMRFLAGTFGSSLLTNVSFFLTIERFIVQLRFITQAGGTVADLFVASQRGIAVALFIGATFMGV